MGAERALRWRALSSQGNITPQSAAADPIDPGVRIGHAHLRTSDIDRLGVASAARSSRQHSWYATASGWRVEPDDSGAPGQSVLVRGQLSDPRASGTTRSAPARRS